MIEPLIIDCSFVVKRVNARAVRGQCCNEQSKEGASKRRGQQGQVSGKGMPATASQAEVRQHGGRPHPSRPICLSCHYAGAGAAPLFTPSADSCCRNCSPASSSVAPYTMRLAAGCARLAQQLRGWKDETGQMVVLPLQEHWLGRRSDAWLAQQHLHASNLHGRQPAACSLNKPYCM